MAAAITPPVACKSTFLNPDSMKNKLLMLCAVLSAGILTGCGATGGPFISIGLGYEGFQGSVTWTPKPKPAPTLAEAAAALNALSGKDPVPAAL